MTPIGDAPSPQENSEEANAQLPWESIEVEEADRDEQVVAVQPAASPAETGSGFRSGFISPRSGRPEGAPLHQDKGECPFGATATRGDAISKPPLTHEEADRAALAPSRGGGWTIPLLCAGIGLIACCLIIPQADTNRHMAYQKKSLEQDLASIQQQVATNNEFLKRVSDDPGLAERLAQRQMNVVREGSQVWHDPDVDPVGSISPYELVTVPKPAPLPPYQPVGGWFAALCRNAHTNLYLTGAALLMLAAGLVMGQVTWASRPCEPR
jgi:hypothetical protein